MMVQEYRERLFAQLADFDPDEVRSVVDYYTELIEDADDPLEQMQRLGEPEQLAQKIIKENGWVAQNTQSYQQYDQNSRSDRSGQFGQKAHSGWSVGRVLALIFTMPVWITVYAMIFTLAATILTLYIVLPTAFIAAAVGVVHYSGKLPSYSIELIFIAVLVTGLAILLFRVMRLVMRIIGMLAKKFSYYLFMPGRVWTRKSRSRKPLRKGALITGALAAVIGFSGMAVMEKINSNMIETYKKSLDLESFDLPINEDLSDVSLEIDIGNITVLKSRDGKTKLSCDNVERDRLKVDTKEKLGIKYVLNRNKNIFDLDFGFGFGFKNRFEEESTARFTLYLANDTLDSIDVKDLLGKVTIDGLSAGEVSINCSCGDLELTGCDIAVLGIDSDLGAVKISESKINRSTIEASCGSIKLDNTEHLDTADMTCDLGDIDLSYCTFDHLIADNSCGDIEADKCLISGESDLSLDLGAAKLDLIGSDYDIRASTDLGDVTINGEKGVNVTHGSVLIKIYCSSGSIKVDFE